jgi:hypothetical protein
MNKVGKTVLTCCLALGVLAGGAMVSGKTHNGFSSTTSWGKTTATVWFNPSWKIDSGAGYGLTTGKNVKQAYVRLQEGSYDSGRVYTTAATSTSTNKEYSKSVSKNNNPFQTMYTNYGWIYF